MSLVGSLEDLGLGDILQIVSLSRKSGLLLIRSEEGEGRIVFCDGLVRAAYVKGEPEDLRSLLVEEGFVGADEFDRAAELASAHGVPVVETLCESTNLTRESLDSLRRERVERAVFRVFSWASGEFSFEVRDQIDPRDLEIFIPTGINAQYLTMEATRLGDEGGRAEAGEEVGAVADASAGSEADAGPIFFSGEAESGAAPDASPPPAALAAAEPSAAAEPGDAEEPREVAEPIGAGASEILPPTLDIAADADSPESALACAATLREAPDLEAAPPAVAVAPALAQGPVAPAAEAGAASAGEQRRPRERGAARPGVAVASLVSIDPNLGSLEWQKLHLAPEFPRVHIFQNGENGIARIRQYLRRGEIPIVLVSIDLASERVSGVDSLSEFIRRLKLLAPSMPVLVVRYEEARSEECTDAADALLTGPDPAALVNRKSWPKLAEEAERFRSEICTWLARPGQRAGGSNPDETSVAAGAEGAENLRDLRAVSERIRDPANHGEVLKLALKFAAERFSRVAMFMVRDEIAIGVAQIGLPRGGGPDDDQFREVELRAAEVEWFGRVLQSRSSICSPPIGDGDRALALRIGSREPDQAYVAPILSGGRVVALLYADNLPGSEPIGDSSVVEIALHEAGLALERALLKRALMQIGDPSAA